MPASTVLSAPPYVIEDFDRDARIARIREAEEVGDFVDEVFDGMHRAIVELDRRLAAMAADGRVTARHRRALAAQLDFIACEHFGEWQEDLLEDLDEDDG